MFAHSITQLVFLVCVLRQVDPMNLPSPVPSEDYVPPEDVVYEQVWDPSAMSPPASRGSGSSPDLDDLVKDFAGAVSHDKVRRPTVCFRRSLL